MQSFLEDPDVIPQMFAFRTYCWASGIRNLAINDPYLKVGHTQEMLDAAI